MIKSLINSVREAFWMHKWYFVTMVLVYCFHLDEYFPPENDGPKFAINLLIFEFFMAFFAYLAKRNFGIKERIKIEHLQKKLSAFADKESNIKEYILITREIKKLKKSVKPLKTPEFCNFIRSILPQFLFFNKYVCIFPNNFFWSPLTVIVSYPHHNSVSNEVKVGFSFFWTALITVDNYVISKITYE